MPCDAIAMIAIVLLEYDMVLHQLCVSKIAFCNHFRALPLHCYLYLLLVSIADAAFHKFALPAPTSSTF